MSPKTEGLEPHIPGPDIHAEAKGEDQFNHEIAGALLKKTDAHIKKEEEFVNRVMDARKALALAVDTFRADSLTYMDEMDAHLMRLRQTRMAMESESKHILAQCADVRKFFMSDDHESEVERLKEFVSVCERLKALKESGFLDTVADTILKLHP